MIPPSCIILWTLFNLSHSFYALFLFAHIDSSSITYSTHSLHSVLSSLAFQQLTGPSVSATSPKYSALNFFAHCRSFFKLLQSCPPIRLASLAFLIRCVFCFIIRFDPSLPPLSDQHHRPLRRSPLFRWHTSPSFPLFSRAFSLAGYSFIFILKRGLTLTFLLRVPLVSTMS